MHTNFKELVSVATRIEDIVTKDNSERSSHGHSSSLGGQNSKEKSESERVGVGGGGQSMAGSYGTGKKRHGWNSFTSS